MSAKTSVFLNRGSAAHFTPDWNKRRARRSSRRAGRESLVQNLPLLLRRLRAVPHPAPGVRPQRTDLPGAARPDHEGRDMMLRWGFYRNFGVSSGILRTEKVSHHHQHLHPLTCAFQRLCTAKTPKCFVSFYKVSPDISFLCFKPPPLISRCPLCFLSYWTQHHHHQRQLNATKARGAARILLF